MASLLLLLFLLLCHTRCKIVSDPPTRTRKLRWLLRMQSVSKSWSGSPSYLKNPSLFFPHSLRHQTWMSPLIHPPLSYAFYRDSSPCTAMPSRKPRAWPIMALTVAPARLFCLCAFCYLLCIFFFLTKPLLGPGGGKWKQSKYHDKWIKTWALESSVWLIMTSLITNWVTAFKILSLSFHICTMGMITVYKISRSTFSKIKWDMHMEC